MVHASSSTGVSFKKKWLFPPSFVANVRFNYLKYGRTKDTKPDLYTLVFLAVQFVIINNNPFKKSIFKMSFFKGHSSHPTTTCFSNPASASLLEIWKNEKYQLKAGTFFSTMVQSVLKNTNIKT